jgi:hypothetical protein
MDAQQQQQTGPVRPNRPGQACPFNCDGGHEYKPLLNHFLKVHLAFTDDELAGDGSRKKCRYCHLTLRTAVVDVHAFLQHDIRLPEALEQRLDAVAAGAWGSEYASPIVNPTPSADDIAAEFAEYWDSDYDSSPMADAYDEEGAMSPMTQSESEEEEEAVASSRPVELEVDSDEYDENGEKWLLVRDFLKRPDVWRADKKEKNTWRAVLPVFPDSCVELEHWSLAWALDAHANKGTRLHFLVRERVTECILFVAKDPNIVEG